MIRITGAIMALAFTFGATAPGFAQTQDKNSARSNLSTEVVEKCPKDHVTNAGSKCTSKVSRRSPSTVAVDNVLRRALRVSDPNDADQLAKALLE